MRRFPPDEAEAVKYEDFSFVTTIGNGSFGTVWKARHGPTGDMFAVKVLPKDSVRKQEDGMRRVLREKRILMLLSDNPFVVTLQHTFQSQNSLYFVMDLAPHGDLFTLLKMIPGARIAEDQACLVGAEIVVALSQLHMVGITHRDIKEENILIGFDGHIMIAGQPDTHWHIGMPCLLLPPVPPVICI